MKIQYVIPSAADAGDLARLHAACWRETYDGLVPAAALESISVAEKVKMWTAVIADPLQFKLAALVDDVFAGFVICGPARDGAGFGGDGEILAIYLLNGAQRLGIGRTLISRAAAFWLQQGGHKLAVVSLQANRKAAAFYEALGAIKVHSGPVGSVGAVTCDYVHVFSNLPALAGGEDAPSRLA